MKELKQNCICITEAGVKVCRANCTNKAFSKIHYFSPNWSKVKGIFDRAEWCFEERRQAEENENLEVLICWLDRVTFSTKFLKDQYLKAIEENDNLDPIINEAGIVALISDPVAKEKIQYNGNIRAIFNGFDDLNFFINE